MRSTKQIDVVDVVYGQLSSTDIAQAVIDLATRRRQSLLAANLPSHRDDVLPASSDEVD